MENATKITCPVCGTPLMFAGRNNDFIFRHSGNGEKLQAQAKCLACEKYFNYDLILVDNPQEVSGNEIWKE